MYNPQKATAHRQTCNARQAGQQPVLPQPTGNGSWLVQHPASQPAGFKTHCCGSQPARTAVCRCLPAHIQSSKYMLRRIIFKAQLAYKHNPHTCVDTHTRAAHAV